MTAGRSGTTRYWRVAAATALAVIAGAAPGVAQETGVADALHERDARDMRVNPFRPTGDAIELDTTELDVAATVDLALALIRERAPELLP